MAECKIIVNYSTKPEGYGIAVTVEGDAGCIPMGMLETIRDKMKKALHQWRYHGQQPQPIGVKDGRARRARSTG